MTVGYVLIIQAVPKEICKEHTMTVGYVLIIQAVPKEICKEHTMTVGYVLIIQAVPKEICKEHTMTVGYVLIIQAVPKEICKEHTMTVGYLLIIQAVPKEIFHTHGIFLHLEDDAINITAIPARATGYFYVQRVWPEPWNISTSRGCGQSHRIFLRLEGVARAMEYFYIERVWPEPQDISTSRGKKLYGVQNVTINQGYAHELQIVPLLLSTQGDSLEFVIRTLWNKDICTVKFDSRLLANYQTNLVVVTDRQQNNDVTDLVRTVPGQYWIGLTLLQNLTGETWASETEIASQLLADVPSTNGLIAKWSSGENGTILQGYWDVNEPDLRRGGCVYLSDSGRELLICCLPLFYTLPSISADQCHFHVMSNQGQLSSPGYPGQYPNNTQCSWLIEGPPCSVVKVQFSKIETEPDFDEVRVLVGGRTVSMSEYVDRYSGNLTDVQVISPNNLLIIKFSSDHSNSFNGFTAQWEVVTHNIPVTGLPLVANLSLQEVTSPFYPSYYISEFLEWIISPQHARNVIKLQVLDLDLDEGDYVIVRHNNVYGEVLAVFSSIGGPSTVISVNALHITMKVKTSYSRQYHRGFRFSYTEGCDVILNEDMGMVFSPGYGVLNYPAYQNCSWTLVASQGRRPTLLFDEEFHLEDGYDFLQIYDGLNDTGEPLHPTGSLGLTGILAPPPLTSSTNQLHINLRSDSLLQYKGYRARFSIGCPDPTFNNNTMVSPSSSSYEFGSFLNISCKPGYTFLEEEFQHDNNTSKQYVEMRCLYGGIWNVINIPQCQARYCGPPPAVKSGYLLHGEGVQYGSSVTYSCEDGHIPTGNVTVVCQKDGMWETVPSCYAVNCSLPAIVPNATSVLESGSGWDFGSRVVYTCDAGFQLLGSAILFCLSNGTWNEEAPSCERVSCPVPEIEHGKVDTPGLRMLYKDTATLTCDAGFLIIGTSTVTCHANQTFGSLPSCEDVDECENDTTCDEISQNCINTMGSYMCHCKAGYQENGTFCQDIDECATNSSNCSQDCENFAGGYQCICNLGYELYTANGTQGYFIPIEETGTLAGDRYHLNHTCVLATCPSDGPNMWVNASVPATVIFPSVMRYLDVVSLICDVPGMETFNKTRQCLYDQPTDTYRLIGDSYECGEINCRVPYNLPNGKVELVTGTTFGSAFNITCDALYYLHGNSSEGDKTVRCGSDGYWDYGSLVCLPVRCPDPGRPRGGSFVGTDFSLGGTVQFYCDDPELEVVGNSQLECVSAPDNSSLIWNSTLPICKDVIRPTITGCPVDSVIVNKYSSPMISVPVANDNIALANYTVSPVYFNPSDPTVENLTIVYTATDFSGNMEECRITILVLDESLPTIQCPESFTVYLTDEDHPYNLSISSANFSVSSSSSWTLDFGPQQVPVSAETLDKTFTVYGNITDTWGNSDTCWFQVKVKDICHPSTLTSPINGQLNCSATPDKKGYRCEATCNQDYYFYEDFSPNYDVFITECTVGGNWTSSHVPSCVSSSQTSFRQVQRLVYQPISNASVISEDCMGHYITSIQQTYPTVSERVSNVCVLLGEISIVTITSGQFSNIINNSFTGTYTLEFDPRTVDASHDCVQATSLIFTKTTLVMEEMKNIFGITDCPNITAEHETQVTNEQMCDDSTKTRDQAGTRVCLVCPPGTFKNDVNECELCPFGTYNEEQGMTSCSSCPLGTWTEKGGNSNASDCKGPCQYNKTSGVLDIISGPTSSGSVGQCEQSCEDLEVMTTVRCTGFSYNNLLQRCVLHHGDTVKLMANSTYDHYQRTCDRLSDTVNLV
ncbi:sushi, von Willebrand factor type A, EGF and pentraxin domain-containing protein 1-like [Ylistrum balloti]|uniref:sushi, von Willebrand factor type A, EGF and pentraxin domain-containing protein 1-like n=1 Tax=Ylistrum balloti TaxID=509963 RepID=UPI002905E13A|nr:sushi, von Willebrand factor type A, EGF and pentraxin domain-containing protein 1-like [Ylistrum balloti]